MFDIKQKGQLFQKGQISQGSACKGAAAVHSLSHPEVGAPRPHPYAPLLAPCSLAPVGRPLAAPARRKVAGIWLSLHAEPRFASFTAVHMPHGTQDAQEMKNVASTPNLVLSFPVPLDAPRLAGL